MFLPAGACLVNKDLGYLTVHGITAGTEEEGGLGGGRLVHGVISLLGLNLFTPSALFPVLLELASLHSIEPKELLGLYLEPYLEMAVSDMNGTSGFIPVDAATGGSVCSGL
jgi:hypothetical protein